MFFTLFALESKARRATKKRIGNNPKTKRKKVKENQRNRVDREKMLFR